MDSNLFFETLEKSTEQAFVQSFPKNDIDINLAGLNVRLSFAGNALLACVMPAIEHLIIETAQKIDYTIDLWDSKSTKINFPKAPFFIENIGYRGEISGLPKHIQISYIANAGILSVFNNRNDKAIVCYKTFLNIPEFEIACALRSIFSWILRKNGTIFLHAAAIGTNDGAILIAGNSGAGKSSTALRALNAGHFYYGDDVCAITSSPYPTIYSIYSSGKCLKKDLNKYTKFHPFLYNIDNVNYHKRVFFLADLVKKQSKKSDKLSAIILPVIDEFKPLSFESISVAKVMSVLCTSTMTLLPDSGNEIYKIVSDTVKAIPCFQLNLGNNPEEIPEALSQFISALKN